MKKLTRIVASMLALSCINLVGCGDDESYTVTLMDGNTVVDTMEKDKETHLTVPQAPTKEGYTFVGWYVDAALTVPYEPSALTANLILYAKYTPNTMYITFNLNGGQLDVNRVEVKNGQAYQLPTPTKTGYTFTGWTVDGEEFPASGTYNKSNSIRVSANWTINQYTVTFKHNGDIVATQDVEYKDKATAVTTWVDFNEGYEIVGTYTDEAMTQAYDFTQEVTESLTLYVKTQPRTFDITVNQDGDTPLDTTAVYGGAYSLPETPTREGYIFKGYTLNDEPFAASGTYHYTDDILVVATWEKDETFNKSTISFYDGNKEIDSLTKVVEDGSTLAVADLIDAPTKKGHTFKGWYTDSGLQTPYTETIVTDDMKLYAKYEANPYTITVNFDGGTEDETTTDTTKTVDLKYGDTYELPAKPVKNGFKFLGYTYKGEAFAVNGTYTYEDSISVTATWAALDADVDEDGEELLLKKDNYFKERTSQEEQFTYVFVTGKTYNFGGEGSNITEMEIIGADTAATLTDLTLTTTDTVSDFKLRITKDFDGTEYTYERKAKIVDQVSGFAAGNDYLSAWGAGVDRSTNFQDTSKTVANTTMSVGKSNYIPDLSMLNDTNETLSLTDANVVITVTDDGEGTNDYTVSNGAITFGESVEVGSVVEVTYQPKYSLTNQSVSVKLAINDGVNVYDNDSLKSAYGNTAVSEINVLRNIKAVLRDSDYVYKDGVNTGVPINEYKYGVYTRDVAATNDKITVNGNFFKIDGSELPLMNNDVGGRDWSVAGENSYYVNNMQLGIFLYKNEKEDKYFHDGQATFNDLYITGNYVKAQDDGVEYNGKTLLTQSGAYHGIVLRGGTVTTNNTTVVNTNIALFSDGNVSGTDATQQASQWLVNASKLDHSWGNQVYMYHYVKLTISNSYLGDCGGAAIHLDDIAHPKTVTTIESSITMDSDTKVENFLIGTETYFASRGPELVEMAVGMKTAIENQINPNNAGSCTVIKTIGEGETVASTFNLVLLVRGVNSTTSEWAADNTGHPDIVFTNQTLLSDGTIAGYLPFNTAMMAGGTITDAAQYMCGYVEVMAK
ncbi:MAG: InlB B-repeat-containing protein [Clostridia bacterium]|nr:InlB B-repeat-containing protein [Clostridia bacterium]